MSVTFQKMLLNTDHLPAVFSGDQHSSISPSPSLSILLTLETNSDHLHFQMLALITQKAGPCKQLISLSLFTTQFSLF
jgi:hypothetical protein